MLDYRFGSFGGRSALLTEGGGQKPAQRAEVTFPRLGAHAANAVGSLHPL